MVLLSPESQVASTGPNGSTLSPAERKPAVQDRKEERYVIRDLSVLTPPLVVCVAFLIGVGAFLRREMGARRRRGDQDVSDDISPNGTIPRTEGNEAAAPPDDEEARDAD
jgi:hypothetical protein